MTYFPHILVLLLLAYIAYLNHRHEKERRYLLKARLAKDSIELATSEKIEDKTPASKPEIDLVPLSELSDKEFDKVINGK